MEAHQMGQSTFRISFCKPQQGYNKLQQKYAPNQSMQSTLPVINSSDI